MSMWQWISPEGPLYKRQEPGRTIFGLGSFLGHSAVEPRRGAPESDTLQGLISKLEQRDRAPRGSYQYLAERWGHAMGSR